MPARASVAAKPIIFKKLRFIFLPPWRFFSRPSIHTYVAVESVVCKCFVKKCVGVLTKTTTCCGQATQRIPGILDSTGCVCVSQPGKAIAARCHDVTDPRAHRVLLDNRSY